MTNPFEETDLLYVVLANQADDHCLWPSFAPIPTGWHPVHDPATREECLAYLATHWPGRPNDS